MRKAQRGVALIVSLLLLVVITLLAVGAMRNTILQERMASNLKDRELALQIVETTIRHAAEALPPALDSAWYFDQLPNPQEGGEDRWDQSAIWEAAKQIQVPIADVNYQGQFIVENLGLWASKNDPSCSANTNQLCERPTYRITARNQPVNGRASVVLQVVWRM